MSAYSYLPLLSTKMIRSDDQSTWEWMCRWCYSGIRGQDTWIGPWSLLSLTSFETLSWRCFLDRAGWSWGLVHGHGWGPLNQAMSWSLIGKLLGLWGNHHFGTNPWRQKEHQELFYRTFFEPNRTQRRLRVNLLFLTNLQSHPGSIFYLLLCNVLVCLPRPSIRCIRVSFLRVPSLWCRLTCFLW